MSRQKKVENEKNSIITGSQDAQYIVMELEKYFDQKIEPISQSFKYAMSPEETAKYTGIGLNTIREIIKANPYAKWHIQVGKKHLIIRELFEEYLKGGKCF